MKKIPEINLQYWALIISATTLGETAGDLISMSLGIGYGYGALLLIGLFVIALIISLLSKIQHPVLYWTVITLASTAGTCLCDYVTRSMGLGYIWGTLLLVSILSLVFMLMRKLSPSYQTETVLTVKTEFLYWLAILISSTLGTSLGDMLSNDLGLGFDGGTIVLASLLLIVALLTFFTKISRELTYWLAIVITHPIGATIGDYMTKPEGLNLGNITSSAILLLVFVMIILIGIISGKVNQPKADLKNQL